MPTPESSKLSFFLQYKPTQCQNLMRSITDLLFPTLFLFPCNFVFELCRRYVIFNQKAEFRNSTFIKCRHSAPYGGLLVSSPFSRSSSTQFLIVPPSGTAVSLNLLQSQFKFLKLCVVKVRKRHQISSLLTQL